MPSIGRLLLLLCVAAEAARNESVLDLAPRFAERVPGVSDDDDGEVEITGFKVRLLCGCER